MEKRELTIKEMAKMGGKARAGKLTKEQLSKIGKKGAKTRWAKSGKKGGN